MKRASITEVKNQLSALLDRVRHGESVLIEDRGVAVAQLNPVTGRTVTTDRDRLARLERQGILRPAVSTAPSTLLLAPPPQPRQRVSLSQLVRAERAEAR
jgi:prevent-host-death family protein